MNTLPAGSSPAMGLSVALHLVAFAIAGGHARAPHVVTAPSVEIAIDAVAPPVAPPPQEPASNVPSGPTPLKDVPAHNETTTARASAPLATARVNEAPLAEAPAATTDDHALPRFNLATSSGPGFSQGLAPTTGPASALHAAENDEAPYDEKAVDVPAQATRRATPTYPLEARAAGREATVRLELVLSTRGAVTDVRATSHPGSGFEDAAVAAARKTLFAPALKRGRPVPVRMAWTVEFRLQ